MKKYIYFALFFFSFQTIHAQEVGLSFMNGLWQRNQTNPAAFSKNKFVLSLPDVYAGISNSMGSFNDMLIEEADGSYLLEKTKLINQLNDKNMFRAEAAISTIGVGIGGKNWRASLGHQVRINSLLAFPKALAELGFEGNAQFVGETANVAPEFYLDTYSEIAAGFAMKFSKLKVGARIKYLNGIANVMTENNTASLYTDPDYYALTLNTDYRINTSATVPYGGLDEFGNETFNFDVSSLFGGNFGMAFDIGAEYDLTKQLTLSASITDLGFIKWKENVYNNESKGVYTFEGVDAEPILDGDEEFYTNVVDSIGNTFDFVETQEAYSSGLPVRNYLSATYQLNEFFRFGGLIMYERVHGHGMPAFAINAATDLGKIFSFGLVLSRSNMTKTILGANMNLKLGPVQLFALSDNVFAAINPLKNSAFNTRFGLNIAIK